MTDMQRNMSSSLIKYVRKVCNVTHKSHIKPGLSLFIIKDGDAFKFERTVKTYHIKTRKKIAY